MQVAFAASRDDVTPVLTGVRLEVSGTQLSLVAPDRYRGAAKSISGDHGGTGAGDEPTTALVPARTLTEVGKTFAHSGDIQVAFSASGDREIIAFTSGNKTVTCYWIKGNFPPVRRLFPEQTGSCRPRISPRPCAASRSCSDRLRSAAWFTFTEDGVSMDASGTEQARATESVDATLAGEEEVTLGSTRSTCSRRSARSRAVRTHHVHLERQREQAQPRADHSADLGGRRERGELQVPAALEPVAALIFPRTSSRASAPATPPTSAAPRRLNR